MSIFISLKIWKLLAKLPSLQDENCEMSIDWHVFNFLMQSRVVAWFGAQTVAMNKKRQHWSERVCKSRIKTHTLPETNSSPLKIGHPKRKLVFQPSIFRCENVSFREGIVLKMTI